jgi:hypothetical protein
MVNDFFSDTRFYQNAPESLAERIRDGHVNYLVALMESTLASPGPIYELIRQNKMTGLNFFPERTTGRGSYDVSDAFLLHSPNVGPVIYRGRSYSVTFSVTQHDYYFSIGYTANY